VVASSERLVSGGDHISTNGSGHLCTDDSPAVATTSARAPLRRGPRPHPPTGGNNEAIKAKEMEARRQVALMVSLAEATTSAVDSLTSGSDHLNTDDSGHLCTGGLPATATASARAKRSSLLSSHGSEDKTIQECVRHPHGVRRLVQPPGRRWSSAAGDAGDTMDVAEPCTMRPSPVRWTDSHAPTKRQEAAPKPSRPRSQTCGS
jgi:hypothetical protein